ncbi:MAG: cob(I)yrinic acid a,c-diamide adenosyltransferase [Chthonomonadales bacterium]|nr:cob(I)yrinic acid a,c-diamide adenosyltransferase [Chthonomonadales bacterium]
MAQRIYTRSGDRGETGLFGGRRVPKDHDRVAAFGAVDELNCALGVVRTLAPGDLAVLVARLQSELFALGADLATPDEDSVVAGGTVVARLPASLVAALEADIDALEATLAPLSSFILPGGCPLAAQLHVARAVCRRAERAVVALMASDSANPEVLRYLNRLSDLLFVAARAANLRAGVPDLPWSP